MSNMNERGQLYVDQDGGETVTIAGTDTYVEVAAGNVTAGGNNSYVDETVSSGRLKLSKGKHLVIATASISVTSGKVIEMAVVKNGVTGEQAQILASLTSDGGREAMTAAGIVDSDGDDEFAIAFANQTDTTNVTVYQCSITAVAIDTTPPRPGTP